MVEGRSIGVVLEGGGGSLEGYSQVSFVGLSKSAGFHLEVGWGYVSLDPSVSRQ